jgi:hypothetical protein
MEKIPGKKHPSDLLTGPGLFNLLLNYIKDMKNDNLQILLSQEVLALLESFKVSPNELTKLNEEQLKKLKETILLSNGHFIVR